MTDTFHNSHLAPVFADLLPALEAESIQYWVCGGVGIAGALGRFIRENGDVDAYVSEAGFAAARSVVHGLCRVHGWKLGDSEPLKGRPQFYVRIGGDKRFSVVPVYETPSGVEYRTKFALTLPAAALQRESRDVGGFRFFAPPAAVAKVLLRALLVERPKEFNVPGRRRIDALALFTREELEEIEQAIAERRAKRRRPG